MLKRNGSNGMSGIFHTHHDGFYVLVNMLTKRQSEVLAQSAAETYGINVAARQVAHLVLARFECSITFFINRERILIKGMAREFHTYPLRVDFRVPVGTRERLMFDQAIQSEQLRDIECTAASQGRQTVSRSLTLTAREVDSLGINEMLSRPPQSTTPNSETFFVTKEQIKQLTTDVYSILNIAEDYDMSVDQFSEAFVDDFILQAALHPFILIDLGTALKHLSKYGAESCKDMRPDEIAQQFGRIFLLSASGRIVVNDNFTDQIQSCCQLDGRTQKIVFPLFSAVASVAFTRSRSTTG